MHHVNGMCITGHRSCVMGNYSMCHVDELMRVPPELTGFWGHVGLYISQCRNHGDVHF